jgi:hypothetical protein
MYFCLTIAKHCFRCGRQVDKCDSAIGFVCEEKSPFRAVPVLKRDSDRHEREMTRNIGLVLGVRFKKNGCALAICQPRGDSGGIQIAS